MKIENLRSGKKVNQKFSRTNKDYQITTFGYGRRKFIKYYRKNIRHSPLGLKTKGVHPLLVPQT